MTGGLEAAVRVIAERILAQQPKTLEEINRIKIEVSREYHLPRIPGNAEIIASLPEGEAGRLIPILRRKRIRSASGVIVVAVMTEPRECPHGRCAYCPGGPEEGVPQSYTGHEPAAMRGIQNKYDPYRQVASRISQLRRIGHEVDKVDLIIMGGTFPASPIEYQEWFVKRCLDAITGVDSEDLLQAKELAEVSRIRNVGITVETRPDTITMRSIDHMLGLGVTRVELGVQNIYDDIYQLVGRGHTVKDVIEATGLLRDSGLKVCYHMMPGLPGSSWDRDIEAFERIFTDPRFRPDMLKIYPTLVLKGTKLHEWWTSGDYDPLSTEEAVELIARVKQMVPPWIRIMRVQRDIPSNLVEAGVKRSNLRQLVQERLRELGGHCRCIRCREVGHKSLNSEGGGGKVNLHCITYEASEGIENFISVEDDGEDALIGFIRLRIPSENAHRPEIRDSAVVRELHVYGRMAPVGRRIEDAWQHMGWGRVLLSEAERISKERYDMKKLVVLSALGTKEYYRKLGYYPDGVYMSKRLG